MRVAFLYNAESYQVYHGATVAFALAVRPGWSVVVYYLDADTPHHFERIREVFEGPKLELRPLRRSRKWRLLRRTLRRFSLFKKTMLRDNRHELAAFDAIVAQENSAAALCDMGITVPPMIYLPHGWGDRAVSFLRRIARFDFVLLAGDKTERRMLEASLIRPGHYAKIGVVKLEIAARLAAQWSAPFDAERPIVLFNPHREPGLSSWPTFHQVLFDGFAQDRSMNLVMAPHIKMFHRHTPEQRARLRARSTGNVLVDPGSDQSIDSSYPAAAAIYVGDVSSQVYDYLDRPRPCVFLNAHGIDWRDDPNFAHWHMGDVIDDPRLVMDAIRAAPARHALYRDLQARMIAETLGDNSPGASRRAADAIVEFLEREPGAR